ncbi:glycine--tRNA ligase [Candidatus Woesearchaeota archaeon]|nr:glycine--tRNA ligase [Candidatus Woesearchaeota archaeon]
MENKDFQKEFIAFIQDQGFIWGPEPEIYGGFAGFYTYGPMGKLLKNKVESTVRKIFTSNEFWELECPIVVPNAVWEASGHLNSFSDPVIECSKCKGKFRADKIIEETANADAENMSEQQMLTFIQEKKIKCPNCKSDFKYDIKSYSLMMHTKVADQDCALRPETATVTYLPFNRYYNLFRKKLPLAVFQIGKAFRNEISPRQNVLRGREFTQAEAQIFIDPKEKNNWDRFEKVQGVVLPMLTADAQKKGETIKNVILKEAISKKILKNKAYAWCLWLAYNQFLSMGIPADRIRLRQHLPEKRAFYADDAWDIEVNLKSYGWMEMCGIHDRTDYDLGQHSKFSKTKMEASTEDGKKFTPHVLEIAFGIDRPVFALLDIFYEKLGKEEGKTMLRLPYHLSPIDIAIFPLMKKEKLPEKAKEVKEMLENYFIVSFDESGSIGKRYLRAATIGIPYCITIDFDSIDKNDVTIRDRDSEKQIRVKIPELKEVMYKILHKALVFEEAGKLIK